MSVTSNKYAHLSAEQARELLSYDPETGDLTWDSPCRGRPVNRPAGCVRPDGRKQIRINGRIYLAHKVAWLIYYGEWPKHQIDHIDGDPGNNRVVNLRDVTCTLNSHNLKGPLKNNRLGVLGVHKHKRSQKFYAQIGVEYIIVRLGMYNTLDEASEAYVKAKRELHEGNTL